jgi:hypothetical protein
MLHFIDESGSLTPRPPVDVLPTVSGIEFTTMSEEERKKAFDQAVSLLEPSPTLARYKVIVE